MARWPYMGRPYMAMWPYMGRPYMRHATIGMTVYGPRGYMWAMWPYMGQLYMATWPIWP